MSGPIYHIKTPEDARAVLRTQAETYARQTYAESTKLGLLESDVQLAAKLAHLPAGPLRDYAMDLFHQHRRAA